MSFTATSFTATILGCGSSGGVPRPGAGWGVCDPSDVRNRRRRCSLLVTRTGREGVTRVLVDTSPDLREQLLEAEVPALDGVLFTHDHADHTHGIDDLRALVLHNRRRVAIHADSVTAASLHTRFGYLFATPPGSHYPPILDMDRLTAGHSVSIGGAGGVVEALPLRLEHGPDYEALAFRFGGLGYAPDVSLIPPAAKEGLAGLDVLILDSLRRAPHPSHFNLDQALAAIEELAPRRAVLTNLHSDLDYATLAALLPAHVEPAYDGMQIVF